MVNKIKKELTRVSVRLSRILTGTSNNHWPANVLEILETKYHLLPKDLLRLWYIRRRTFPGRSNMDSIFIYDWAKAYDLNISVRECNDLLKYPDLMRFKGYIRSNGEVSIEKIRNN